MNIIELFLIGMSCWNETIWRVLEESDKLPLTLFDLMFFLFVIYALSHIVEMFDNQCAVKIIATAFLYMIVF